ncbi:MAG: M23 family metallopeptidase [Maricaulaceae bacterium]|nr:M23 family metallopeptidase [Maricaulaceae bacterium]
MISSVIKAVWGVAERWFPNRQIYHRSEGQVRYFEVTTSMQLGALAGAAALTCWLFFATFSVAFHGQALATRTADAERARQEAIRMVNEARAAEAAATAFLESRLEEFDRTAFEFQSRHEMLGRLLQFAERMRGADIDPSPSLDDGRILMAAAPADPSPRMSRDPITYIDPETAAPEARVAALISQQDAVLASAEDAAEARLENLRAVLRLTGLRLDDVLAEGRRSSETGGPFVALSGSASFGLSPDIDDVFSSRISRIAARLLEAEELEAAARAAPLGHPLNVPYRNSSGYGWRTDPFTGLPASHPGIDFVAYRRAPILATGPGRVVYAGWRSGYGRTVEIDHGYGFMTRYAHMHSTDVRRGDEVVEGQRIGTMGSTGRSTGTHLHYEVWFKGAHYDPSRFVRAGRYVQQG